MPMKPEQLAAIEKLRTLSAAKLAELETARSYSGSFHDPELQMLRNVPYWVHHVKTGHDNPYAASATEGCLQNLRMVARHFKFKLVD